MRTKKDIYQEPEIQITVIGMEDVISTSPWNDGNDNNEGWGGLV